MTQDEQIQTLELIIKNSTSALEEVKSGSRSLELKPICLDGYKGEPIAINVGHFIALFPKVSRFHPGSINHDK